LLTLSALVTLSVVDPLNSFYDRYKKAGITDNVFLDNLKITEEQKLIERIRSRL
jgi:hypothetical protein